MFDYETAYVTLFYEAKSTSRFIRQKILLNIAPIDEYRLQNKIPDVSKHPFAYTYFYGLLIHKLAHFFDIVHGTRHDFFMTEYRCVFMMKWLNLLDKHGFDSEQVFNMSLYKPHLFDVVL